MSNYEGMNGKGLVKKTDLKKLKNDLIEAHNKQIQKFKPSQLKKMGLKKASIRTTSFPLLERDDDELYVAGGISLNMESGTFNFSIGENNHAVDNVSESSLVFSKLMSFMNKLEEKGSKYGAETYYWSEYDEDEYGNRTSGTTTYYGAWSSPYQTKQSSRRTFRSLA